MSNNTFTSSTAGTVNVVYYEPTTTYSSVAPRKKTLLELLDERVEAVCAVGRERLAA